MSGIDSPKGQCDSSAPGASPKCSDLHPGNEEILKTEPSASLICPLIHLGIVLDKVKNSHRREYATFKHSS